MQLGNNIDFASVFRALNLTDATTPQEPATLAQLQAAIEGLAWKDNARVAAQVNVTVSSPGATIDGQTMVSGDRVLLRSQTTASENGTYVWTGAATPMTRTVDMNASVEFTSAIVPVDAGTDAGTQWRQTAVNPTVGTTAILFVAFGTAAPAASAGTAGIAAFATQAEVDAGSVANKTVTPVTLLAAAFRVRKVSADIGDGSATLFTVTHNLGTRDVEVSVRRNSGLFDFILVDTEATTTNTVQVRFAAGFVPTTNQFRAIVVG